MQVSSDLSIVDLDVPFAFMFSISASLNAYSNLGVLVIVTWQILFIAVPMIVLATRLQVILRDFVDWTQFFALLQQGFFTCKNFPIWGNFSIYLSVDEIL
jgi:hypothetical protein